MSNIEREKKQIRDAYRQFARNFRWGGCGGCPTDTSGHAYPEFCGHTERHDHNQDAEQLFKTYQKYRKDWDRQTQCG